MKIRNFTANKRQIQITQDAKCTWRISLMETVFCCKFRTLLGFSRGTYICFGDLIHLIVGSYYMKMGSYTCLLHEITIESCHGILFQYNSHE